MASAAPTSRAPAFSGSYLPDDVTFLMKVATVPMVDVATKEQLIQSGARHYSEMLSPETVPSDAYLRLYEQGLARNGLRLAQDVVDLAGALAERAAGRPEIVIASLARAGTPIGVLLRRALANLGRSAAHYSISIIRDRGIDREALRTIAARHDPRDVVFLDGWTGKGTITRELHAALTERPLGFAPFLAVVADPAGCADLAPSEEDYLIPSGLLNSIVSGLVSRSVLNDQLVRPGDYHACQYFGHLAGHDLSRAFVDRVSGLMVELTPRALVSNPPRRAARAAACEAMVEDILRDHHIADRNRVKPGVAEATRAVLRRVPDRLLIRDPADPDVAHLMQLARERDVTVAPLGGDHGYRAVAVIRSVSSD
jgi:hypothetical protein